MYSQFVLPFACKIECEKKHYQEFDNSIYCEFKSKVQNTFSNHINECVNSTQLLVKTIVDLLTMINKEQKITYQEASKIYVV